MSSRSDRAADDVDRADQVLRRRRYDGVSFSSVRRAVEWYFVYRERLQSAHNLHPRGEPGPDGEMVYVSVDGGAGGDHGIWRRLVVVPFDFTVSPERMDMHLQKRLLAEAPGVLAWLVQGCLDWRREGLFVPARVAEATTEYKRASDKVTCFLDDRCTLGAAYSVDNGALYEAFRQWCHDNGVGAFSHRKFSQRLKRKGFESDRGNRGRYWLGLMLDPQEARQAQGWRP